MNSYLIKYKQLFIEQSIIIMAKDFDELKEIVYSHHEHLLKYELKVYIECGEKII